MKLLLHPSCLEVWKEEGDSKYYGTVNAKGESNLLYAIKNKLNSYGFNLIKKRMWRDGHMVDEMQQYIRSKDGKLTLYNSLWAIRGAEKDYNEGYITLAANISVDFVYPQAAIDAGIITEEI